MTMEAEARNDGSTRVLLGPVERKIVAVCTTIITLMLGWFGATVLQTKSAVERAATQESVQDLSRQQAVMASSLADIKVQLADVPALKLEVAKLAIKDEQHDQDIKELKQLRGLK